MTPTTPKPSNDGGFIAPDRDARAHCWEARDAFFACLDRNSIIDSIKQDEKARAVCGPEHVQFEKNCAASWVGGQKDSDVVERREADMDTVDVLQEEEGHGISA